MINKSRFSFNMEIFLLVTNDQEAKNTLQVFSTDNPFIIIHTLNDNCILSDCPVYIFLIISIEPGIINKHKNLLSLYLEKFQAVPLLLLSDKSPREIIKEINNSCVNKYFNSFINYEELLIAIRKSFEIYKTLLYDKTYCWQHLTASADRGHNRLKDQMPNREPIQKQSKVINFKKRAPGRRAVNDNMRGVLYV